MARCVTCPRPLVSDAEIGRQICDVCNGRFTLQAKLESIDHVARLSRALVEDVCDVLDHLPAPVAGKLEYLTTELLKALRYSQP